MADNVPITAGSGTDVATDDIGSVHYQRVKIGLGADGAATDAVGNSGTVNDGVQRVVLATDVALPAGTNAIGKLAANSGVDIGDVDVTTVPADPFGLNADAASATGSISAKLRFIAATGIPVTGTVTVGSHAVTNVGTFPVQVDGNALTALQLIDDPVIQDDAGVTAGTTKVTMAGAMAVAHGANPDAADANDGGMILMNRHRVQFTIGGHPNAITIKHTTITTAVTDSAIVSVGNGAKIVVTRISATLDNASTVFPTLLVGFGAANTPTTTGVLIAHGGVPAGGGITVGDGSGILGIGADNEDLRVTTTGNATGNGLQICVTYFTIES